MARAQGGGAEGAREGWGRTTAGTCGGAMIGARGGRVEGARGGATTAGACGRATAGAQGGGVEGARGRAEGWRLLAARKLR